MIRIKHIKAHLPYKNCQLSFMLRKKEQNKLLEQNKQNKLKLTQDYVDLDIDCTLQLGQFLNYQDVVELCVIAGKGNQKDFVGFVQVCFKQNISYKESKLGGVSNQDGYLAYSFIKDCPIKLRGEQKRAEIYAHKNKSLVERKPVQRGFIKYRNSSSSSAYSESQMSFDNRSGCQSPFRKNKQLLYFDGGNSQNNKILDQLYHQILEEQLFNRRILNKIYQNQIFYLRYLHRVDTLVKINNL